MLTRWAAASMYKVCRHLIAMVSFIKLLSKAVMTKTPKKPALNLRQLPVTNLVLAMMKIILVLPLA